MAESQSQHQAQGSECQPRCPGTEQMGAGWGGGGRALLRRGWGWVVGLQDVPGEVLRALGQRGEGSSGAGAFKKKSLTWGWLRSSLLRAESGHRCILLESLLGAPRLEAPMQRTWGALVP